MAADVPVDISVRHIDVVRLVTGDQVKVTTWSDDTTTATMLSGSPNAQREASSARTPIGSFLIPRLPVGERMKLDASMFNVTALASTDRASVPISVTFANGVSPHPIDGLDLDLSSDRPMAGGATVVAGSYPTSFDGIVPGDLAGVRSLALPSRQPEPVQVGAPLHTLTIHVSTARGAPVDFAQGFVENVDNSRRYLETPLIDHGIVKLRVPEGHYAVMAYTFSRLMIAPEFSVTSDTAISLNLGDATVKPSATVPSYRLLDSTYSISRYPAKGFSFALTFSGPHFFMRVQPASGRVERGTFTSGVTGTFALRGDLVGQVHTSMAVTADLRPGVPSSLTFTHPRSDFAQVVQHFRSNGPAGLRMTNLSALSRNADLQSFQYYPVRTPGERTVLLQASPRVFYVQEFDPNNTPRSMDGFAALLKGSQYRHAGPAPGVSFAYGPVGPAREARIDGYSVGRYCSLCRFGTYLNGGLTMWSGAGSAMFGFLARGDAGWSLRHDGRVLAGGGAYMSLHAALPAGRQSYVLIAASHPQSPLWQLSTNVRDVWSFTSAAGRLSSRS